MNERIGNMMCTAYVHKKKGVSDEHLCSVPGRWHKNSFVAGYVEVEERLYGAHMFVW